MIEQLVIAYAIGAASTALILGFTTGELDEKTLVAVFVWPLIWIGIVLYFLAVIGAWLKSLFD